MQKLTTIFIGIVLVLFILTGLYIRSSEAEKKKLRSQLDSQQTLESNLQESTEQPQENTALQENSSASAIPQTQLGSIEGSLSFPSSGIPDTLEICAENIPSQTEVCTKEIQKSDDYTSGFGYQLELDPGDYTVYARLPNDPYRAYYSEFVTCGLKTSCPSHKPIIVKVIANTTISSIDPQDWYDSSQTQSK